MDERIIAAARELLDICRRKGKKLAVAESCTGGMLAEVLTGIPGASDVFRLGVVSYCDEMKNQLLSVPQPLLDEYTAVSAPVAEAMASGVRALAKADIALSTTGYAGPGGEALVGLVYIGMATASGAQSWQCQFTGDREAVRRNAVYSALTTAILMEDDLL